MAFEVGTPVAQPGKTSPTTRKTSGSASSKATGLDTDEVDGRTVQDACELIRATYRATADLIAAVYLN